MITCAAQTADCEGESAGPGVVKDWTWHDRYNLVPACPACIAHDRRRVEDGPSDNQVMNGHGIEGGISYNRTWEQR